ncbi:MAG: type II secretion system F family protein [Planctomycetota bacterium]|jgi:general secretion pathway protein F
MDRFRQFVRHHPNVILAAFFLFSILLAVAEGEMQALFGLMANLPVVLLLCWIYTAMRRGLTRRRLFTLHLRACVRMDIPLVEALKAFTGTPGEVARIMKKAARRIEQGESLAEALHSRWRCLPFWYTEMLHIGEERNCLAEVLNRLLTIDIEEEQVQMKLVERMVHPLLLLLSMSSLAFLISLTIIPRLAMMAFELGAHSLSFGHATSVLNWVGIGALVLTLVTLALIPIPWGRNYAARFPRLFAPKHYLRRMTPYLGRRYLEGAVGRWAAVVSMMLDAGEPLPVAMKEALEIETDPIFNRQAQGWVQRVEEGTPLSQAMAQTRFVPRLLLWQIETAEGGATLSQALYQSGMEVVQRLRRDFGTLLQLVAPLITIAVGYGVGLVCMEIFHMLILFTEQTMES